MINRKGYSIAKTAAFAGLWLLAHLQGYIRSHYYKGTLPKDVRFVVSTPGYWSGHAEEDALPEMPAYLFAQTEDFAPGPQRIILCREDVREGLIKARRMHEVLSALLGRLAFVPRDMLTAQVERLLSAMAARADVEVALMPRVAFEKLQMELVCWRDSVAVGWLQDMRESVFADDRATSGSFYGAIGYTWDKLLAGWKRKDKVSRQLRKWLRGKDLDTVERDSAIVRNWDSMPK